MFVYEPVIEERVIESFSNKVVTVYHKIVDKNWLDYKERIEPTISLRSLLLQLQDKVLSDTYKDTLIIFNDYFALNSYLDEIYGNPQWKILRYIPFATDLAFHTQITVSCFNFSYRPDGFTQKLIEYEIEQYWNTPFHQTKVYFVNDIHSCIGCGGHMKNCQLDSCIFDDQMSEYIDSILNSDVVVFATPVYEDHPTDKFSAFVSRLSRLTKANRRAFIGKKAILLTTAYCSGTKSTLAHMMQSLEMLGFTIIGRSCKEYIELWKDSKVRGDLVNSPEEWKQVTLKEYSHLY